MLTRFSKQIKPVAIQFIFILRNYQAQLKPGPNCYAQSKPSTSFSRSWAWHSSAPACCELIMINTLYDTCTPSRVELFLERHFWYKTILFDSFILKYTASTTFNSILNLQRIFQKRQFSNISNHLIIFAFHQSFY